MTCSGGPGQGRPPLPIRPGRAPRRRRLPRAVPRRSREHERPGREPGLRGILPPRGAGRGPRPGAVLRPLRPLAGFAGVAAPLPPDAQPGRRRHGGRCRVSRSWASGSAGSGSARSWARAGPPGSTWRATSRARRPRGRAEGLARPGQGAVDPWGGSTTRTSSRSCRWPDEPETGLRGLCMPYRPGLPLDEVIRGSTPASRPRAGPGALGRAGPRRARPRGRAEQPGWQGFPTRGTYAEAVAWVVADAGPGPGARPFPGHPPPRRQAGQRPADVPRRAAAARLQPGPRPQRRRPGRGRPARRDPALHGPRAARGLPRPRALGRRRRGRRPVRARACCCASC